MSLTLIPANTKRKRLQLAAVSVLALMLPCTTSLVCAQSGSYEVQANNAPKGWSDWVSEGKALMRQGSYGPAAQAFRRALAVAEAANAGDRRLLETHDAIAAAYAEAGRYAESEREYLRGLALAEKTEGRHSLAYGMLFASLAALPTQTGNRNPVTQMLREAITANRRTGPVRELALAQACLAQLLLSQRRYVEAEFVFLDAQSRAAGLGSTDPGLFPGLLNGLGVLRFDQRRYTESIDLYLEALRLLQAQMGGEHPAVVPVLNNLALSYLKLGRLTDAELTLRRGNAVCGKTLGQDHPTCGAILEGYATILRKLRRKREADAVQAQSKEIAHASRSRNGTGLTISATGLRTR